MSSSLNRLNEEYQMTFEAALEIAKSDLDFSEAREEVLALRANIQALGHVNVDAIDALALAEEAGSSKAVNLVLMGRLSKYFDISADEWLAAIEASVPAKFLEMNKKAFSLGLNA